MKKIFFCLFLNVLVASSCATYGPFYVEKRWGDTAPYGFHPGIDYNIGSGTPIIAVSDGQVIFIRKTIGDGDEVVLKHGQHFISNYAHLSKVFVKNGQFVKRGELIALSGASNSYNRPNYQHLHFGICKTREGGCGDLSNTHNPNLFWLGGKPQCFDPKMDYSPYSQKDITLPIACGDYAKELKSKTKKKD